MLRKLALPFLLLVLFIETTVYVHLVIPSGATIFVDGPTGVNGGSCGATQQTACKTLKYALENRISGQGNTINVCNGTVHREFDEMTVPSAGTSGSRNVITGFNCTSIRNSTVDPTITQMALYNSGWTNEGSNRWSHAHTTGHIGRMLFQDADKQCISAANFGVTHEGYTCQYNPADPATHHLLNTGWHPMRSAWGDAAGHCEAGNNNCAVSCPGSLNQDHEYCYDAAHSKIYLHSTSNPATRYTDPGVEVLGTPATLTSFLLINKSFWTVKNIKIRGVAGIPIQVLAEGGVTIQGLIFQDVSMTYSGHRIPQGYGGCCPGLSQGINTFQMAAQTASDTITNVTITRVVTGDSGRDTGDFSNAGLISNVTADDWEQYNAFNHGAIRIGHNGGAGNGTRSNIVLNNLNVHDTCNGPSYATGALPAAIPVSFTGLYSHDSLKDVSDERRPSNAECGLVNAPGLFLDNANTTTCTRCLLVRNKQGVVHQQGNLTLTNSTIADNTTTDIVSTAGGGTITMNRTIVSSPKTNTVGGTSFLVGCTSPCGVTFAGGDTTAKQNLFFRAGYGSGTNNAPFWNVNAKTLAQWQVTNGLHDSTSQIANPVFVDRANGDYNLDVGSPGDNLDLGISPFCDTGIELGALELPIFVSRSTLDNNTEQATICSLAAPSICDATKLHPCVAPGTPTVCSPGEYRTASNCAVFPNGTGVSWDVSAPNIAPAQELLLDSDYGALCTAPQAGGTNGVRGCRQARDNQGVINNVSSGTDPAPVFSSCLIPDTASDVTARITFTANAAGNMLPASGATGIFFDEGGVEKTISGTGTRIGANEFEFSVTSAFSNGTTVRARAASSNITGGTGTALANFSYGAGTTCVNQVAAPPVAPTLLQGVVPANDSTGIVATFDPAGGTLVPANDCTGLSVDSGHTVTDCDRIAINQMDVRVSPAFVFGEPAKQLCYTQGTGNPITNGTTEVAAGCVTIVNNVPAPPGEGTFTETHARCFKAGGGTIVGGFIDTTCDIVKDVPYQVWLEFGIAGGTGNSNSYMIQGCASINCTASDPDDANWFTLDDDCVGHLACYGEDTSVTNGAAVAASLSGCTLDGGTYRKAGGQPTAPFAMVDGHCATFVGVIKVSPTLTSGTDSVSFRIVKGSGEQLDAYTVLGKMAAQIPSARR